MPRVVFVSPDGARTEVAAAAGETVLELAWGNGIDVEGACEGAMACSTCHVIVDPGWFARLAPASEEEEHLLDLAWGVRPTSRLGCQVVVPDACDGLTLTLPAATCNQM